VIATALKKERASKESLAAAVASMTRLNRDAAEALRELDVGAGLPRPTPAAEEAGGVKPPLRNSGAIHAVTDVTGFGLLGHAKEMAAGSGVSLEIEHTAVEYLPGAVEAARDGNIAGGLVNNRDWLEGCVEFAGGVSEEHRALLFDPQTSGGLLVAIAAEAANSAVRALAARNVAARQIGRVVAKRSPLIAVR
jgi:selenide,water dikinase